MLGIGLYPPYDYSFAVMCVPAHHNEQPYNADEVFALWERNNKLSKARRDTISSLMKNTKMGSHARKLVGVCHQHQINVVILPEDQPEGVFQLFIDGFIQTYYTEKEFPYYWGWLDYEQGKARLDGGIHVVRLPLEEMRAFPDRRRELWPVYSSMWYWLEARRNIWVDRLEEISRPEEYMANRGKPKRAPRKKISQYHFEEKAHTRRQDEERKYKDWWQ